MNVLFDPTSHQEDRIKEVFQLLQDPRDEATDLLIYVLFNDPSPIVRHEAAYSLGERKAAKGGVALLEAITHDSNDFVVHEAALAIANIGDPMAQPVLEQLLLHANPDVVDTAEIALQRLAMRKQAITFKELGLDPFTTVLDLHAKKEYRIQAAFTLMDVASDEAVDYLIKAMQQEPSPIVKHEIIFSLGETAAARAVPKLFAAMAADGNLFVLHEASLAIATLGLVDAADGLRGYLSHEHPDIVESVEIALYRLLH